jgi:hypothetical protein
MNMMDRVLFVAVTGGVCAGLGFFAADQAMQCWEDRVAVSEYRIENAVTIQQLKDMRGRAGL